MYYIHCSIIFNLYGSYKFQKDDRLIYVCKIPIQKQIFELQKKYTWSLSFN